MIDAYRRRPDAQLAQSCSDFASGVAPQQARHFGFQRVQIGKRVALGRRSSGGGVSAPLRQTRQRTRPAPAALRRLGRWESRAAWRGGGGRRMTSAWERREAARDRAGDDDRGAKAIARAPHCRAAAAAPAVWRLARRLRLARKSDGGRGRRRLRRSGLDGRRRLGSHRGAREERRGRRACTTARIGESSSGGDFRRRLRLRLRARGFGAAGAGGAAGWAAISLSAASPGVARERSAIRPRHRWAADHQEMFDIVAAHDNELALPIREKASTRPSLGWRGPAPPENRSRWPNSRR